MRNRNAVPRTRYQLIGDPTKRIPIARQILYWIIALTLAVAVTTLVLQIISYTKTLQLDDLKDVELNQMPPMVGQVLIYNGSSWIPADATQQNPLALNNLTDVDLDTTSPMLNQVLIYNGTDWLPGSIGSTLPTELDDLTDVTITNVTNGNALMYQGSQWVNGRLGMAAVDPMEIQNRILGSCPGQHYIRQILENGTVICDNSLDNNVVGSSQIIDGSITDQDVDENLVQLRITGQCLGDGNHIKSIAVDGSVMCSTLNAPMSVGSLEIIDNSLVAQDVDSSSIQERVVGTCTTPGEQIIAVNQDGTVVCSGLVASGSVDTAQIVNNAITTDKIATGAVDSDAILDNTIQEVDMSDAYQIGVPNGIVPLDGMGLINISFLPPLAITTVTVCPNIACRDAVSPIQSGDTVKVLDSDGMGNPNTYIWDGTTFQSIMIPPDSLSLTNLIDVNVPTPTNAQVLMYNSGTMMWEAMTVTMETIANLGTGGQGLFSAKVGSEFQFFSLIAGSSKLSIAAPSAGNVALDVVPANINHDDLGAIPANNHVDHTAVLLIGGNGITIDGGASGNINASRTIALSASLAQLNDVQTLLTPQDLSILQYNATSMQWEARDQTTGENLGTGTGDVYIGKDGSRLQFRRLLSGSNSLNIANNGNDIELSIGPGNLNHNALQNYAPNEHIDHSTVILSVSGGLTIDNMTMSRDITTSRSLGIDPSVIQLRVSDACPPGTAMQSILENGTVTCEQMGGIGDLQDVTTTMPANGQILKYMGSQWVNGVAGASSVDPMQIQVRITGTCPAMQYMREVSEDGTVVCDDALNDNVVGSAQIIDGSIAAADVDSNSVQERIIGQCLGDGNYVKSVNSDGSVVCGTENAPMSVGSFEITDGSIVATDIDSTSVQERVSGTCSIFGESITAVAQNGAVTCSGAVAFNSVNTSQLVDNAVTNDKIATGAVNSNSILDNSIAEVDMSAAYKIGVANGIVPLDGSGLIDQSYLPPVSITSVTVCADIACRDAVSPIQTGDVVKVIDSDGSGNPNTYIWDGTTFISIMVPPDNIALNDLTNVNAASPTNGQILSYNSGTMTWDAISHVFETIANIGTGVGIYNTQVGNEFQFNSLVAGSSKLSIAAPSAGNIALDVVPANINHDDLGGIPTNDHIDHSTVFLTGVNGISIGGGLSADITTSRTIELTASLSHLSDISDTLAPSNDQILEYNSTSGLWIAGNKISGTNVGTGSGSIFVSKVGNLLQFRRILAGSSALTVTNNANDVQIDIQTGNINHDALDGFFATEHVNHSAVLLGVSGGLLIEGGTTPQDITVSRTFGVDSTVIQSRVTGTCPLGSAMRVIDEMGTVTCQVGVDSIDDLSDVTITSAMNGNALVYMGGQWINGQLGASAINSMEIQRRVLGTCPSQQYIRAIAEDGTVTCDDAINANTVGSTQVIDGSLTSTDVDTSSIQARVTGMCLGDGNYIKSIASDGTVVCSTLNAPMSVSSLEITDGTIVAADIDSTSVQERVSGMCTTLGEAVTAIAVDGTVTCSGAVSLNSVGTDQLINDAVTNAKIGTGAVNSDSILNDSIQEIDMSAAYKIGVANGIVPLNAGGVIDSGFLPPVSITTVTVCPNITCRDAVSPIESGDVVKVLDSDGMGNPNTYIWDGTTFQSIMVPQDMLSLNDLVDVDAASPANGQTITYNSVSMKWEPASLSTETAANLGTGGQGLFSAKVGSVLQFYSLIAGSTKVSIAAPLAGNVALDIVPGNINHDDLGNIPVNDHIDHSAVVLTGGSGITIDGGVSGDITASRTIALSASLSLLTDVDNALAPSNDQILEYDSMSGTWKAGDKITGVNVGTGSGHIFVAKVNDELQFRQILGGSNKLSVTNNMNDVQIDVLEGNLDHNSLANYVGAEHVLHTSVLLTGTGGILIDGGAGPLDISASRTLGVDPSVIQSRVTGTCPADSFISAIAENGGVTCTAATGNVVGPGPTVTDNAIARFDGTGGLSIQESLVTISDTGAVAGATTYNGVAVDTVQVTGGIGLTNTGTATLETNVQIDLDINSLPLLPAANVDFNNDHVVVYDTSAATHYKMPFADLPLFEKPPVGEIYYFDLGKNAYSVSPSPPTSDGLTNMIEILPTISGISAGARLFTAGTTARLRYTGTPNVYCHTAASISISSNNNRDIVIAIGVTNGGGTIIQPNSRVELSTQSSRVQSTALHAYIPLSNNDDISLFVGRTGGSTNINIHSVNLFAMCMVV